MAEVSTRILTVPNALSVVRLLLIPVFLVLMQVHHYGWALLVLAVSSATDFVDGYVARHFDQVTRLGQLLDPAVDRLFILTSLIGLVLGDVIPWWLAVVIIARDVMLLALGVVLANHRRGPLPVHHLGKMGTFALLFAMPVLLLAAALPASAGVALPVGWAIACWGVFFYWWAGAAYLVQASRLIRSERAGPGDAPSGASDSLGR